jgi:HlyD family type I secretion membrane fusion protein
MEAQEIRNSASKSSHDKDRIGLSVIACCGIAVVALFFGGFGYWSSEAELASAALAPGKIAVESHRKTIQHLEGGIIKNIHVEEGDTVNKGQLLITLDDTSPRANVERIAVALRSQLALKARIVAERDKAENITFPDELLEGANHPSVAPVIASQVEVFNARRTAYAGQAEILKQQIAQRREEIAGLKGEVKAAKTQIFYLNSEIADVDMLLDKGLVQRPRVNKLKRQRAEIRGEIARASAGIARAQQAIGESRVRIAELETRMISESVEALQEVESKILDLRQQQEIANEVLKRVEIRAPRDGRIVDLKVHTQGGVIRAGNALMHVVPAADRLLVEAQIDPADIDVVYPGQQAEIRLPAYPQRHIKPLKGRLLDVSADVFVDEKSGASYYLGRIELTELLEDTIPGARLQSGMQAETLILTSSTTLLDWLISPLARTLERGLREQ